MTTARRRRRASSTEEIGLKQPTAYTDDDREADRHARGRPCHRCVLPGQGPAAGGAVDHQAARLAGAAGPQRPRGAVHADPLGDGGVHRHLARRHGRRGDLPRRAGTGPGERPRARDAGSRRTMVGSLGMGGSLISLRGRRRRPDRRDEPGRQGPGEHRDASSEVEDILTAQKERVAAVLAENRDIARGAPRRIDRARRAGRRRDPRGDREGDREPSLTHACGGAGRRLAA